MCNIFTNIKRASYIIIVFALVIFFVNSLSLESNYAYAKSETDAETEYNKAIEKILDDINFDNLDGFLTEDIMMNLFDIVSFKDIILLILNGNIFSNYDSFASVIVSNLKTYLLSSLKLIIILLVLVILYKMFESFCVDKYVDIKKVVQMIFAFIIIYLLIVLLKDLADNVTNSVLKVFSFCEVLFPILLSLVLSSGANVSFATYSSLSVVVLETCSYVFIYILIPLAVAIMTLSLASFVSSKKSLSGLVDISKSLFKYVVIAVVSIFGIFSSVSIISAGMKDGLSLKLTKFAIKNYVPVLGGYISEGFDFVKSSSVMVKNAFGICGILVLFFTVLSPLLLYVSYIIVFKILSVIISFLGEDRFANIFSGVSNSVSYFVTVLVGVFLILLIFIYMIIISVSVV